MFGFLNRTNQAGQRASQMIFRRIEGKRRGAFDKLRYIKKGLMIWAGLLLFNMGFGFKVMAEPTTEPPSIISEAAIVIDAENGSILFEKQADQTLYPASLTKIATAIYAIERGSLEDVVTVSERARNTEGTRVYLEEGEQVTLKKLIQGLLINSGNDAGVAIAEHMSGSVEQYAVDINEFLRNEVGVQRTTFKNPHGLYDAEHVTTAADLAAITQYAMKNAVFREIFGTKELRWVGESWDTTLYSHHKLMWGSPYEGVTGGKTGYVDESGVTLATTAEKDGRSIIVITLKSATQLTAYNDTINLLNYALENFQTSFVPKGTVFEAGETEYEAPGDLSYTYAKDSEASSVVTSEGNLNMVDEEGKVFASFALEKKEATEGTEQTFNELNGTTHDGTLLKGNITKLLFVAAVFTLCVAGFINRKSKKQSYKQAK